MSSKQAKPSSRRKKAKQEAPSVVIVGAGIVGLAHAWAAAKRGWRVDVLERNPSACGASVRNFGMVWPIGQTNGQNHKIALQSRQLWLELLAATKLWHRGCGSLHLAYRADELAVIQEFARLGKRVGYDCQFLPSSDANKLSPALRSEQLLGALWSPTELNVDSRQALAKMPGWLSKQYGVNFHFGVTVQRADRWAVTSVNGECWKSDRVIIAAGSDFRFLFPEAFREADFQLCKLQMLKTVAQPKGWTLGPMLASGLTLRHYESFRVCSSLNTLKNRIAEETPELDDYGIHVMASQNLLGEVILGDSHEYGDHVSPFDKQLIDDLILRELKQIIDLPNWEIAERWHGVYPKAPDRLEHFQEIEDNVFAAIASGGCGMTMSFGLAEAHWSSWESSASSTQVAPLPKHSPTRTKQTG